MTNAEGLLKIARVNLESAIEFLPKKKFHFHVGNWIHQASEKALLALLKHHGAQIYEKSTRDYELNILFNDVDALKIIDLNKYLSLKDLFPYNSERELEFRKENSLQLDKYVPLCEELFDEASRVIHNKITNKL